jgi:hypothetical protein
MSFFRNLLDRPGGLLAVSVLLAIAVGLLTSSLFGFGVFLVLPSAVVWLARR